MSFYTPYHKHMHTHTLTPQAHTYVQMYAHIHAYSQWHYSVYAINDIKQENVSFSPLTTNATLHVHTYTHSRIHICMCTCMRMHANTTPWICCAIVVSSCRLRNNMTYNSDSLATTNCRHPLLSGRTFCRKQPNNPYEKNIEKTTQDQKVQQRWRRWREAIFLESTKNTDNFVESDCIFAGIAWFDLADHFPPPHNGIVGIGGKRS